MPSPRGLVAGALMGLLQSAAVLPVRAQQPTDDMTDDCRQQLCDVYKSITTCPVRILTACFFFFLLFISHHFSGI